MKIPKDKLASLPPRKPNDADMENARVSWEKENANGSWDALRTQSKNRLAREQMFHREYHSLCDAIRYFGS